jgi:hypothetical protein
MKPEIWGPPIWLFIHSLVFKLKDEMYVYVGIQLFNMIKRITSYLPCPECSQHAVNFLSGINTNTIKTKDELIRVLYLFHNSVNVRKNKPLYNFSDLNKYESVNLQQAYNNFRKVYHNRGNMNLLAESFQRDLILKDLKIWLSHHSNKFDNAKKTANNAIKSDVEAETHLEVVEIAAIAKDN